MSGRLFNETERNIRGNDFLQANKTDFAGNAFATAQIALLKSKVAEVGDFYKLQISDDDGIRQNYEIADQSNADLTYALREIVDFAETMADEIEGIEEKFHYPRTGGKRGRIARARAFAADAAPYEKIFTERGLDEDFIAALNTKADRLEQSLAAAVSHTADRVGSTESKMLAHKSSNKIIKTLDPIVRKRYRSDPKKLAAWNFAAHLQRADKNDPDPEKK